MNTTPANITRPVTGPSTNSSLRFVTPFILPPPSAVPLRLRARNLRALRRDLAGAALRRRRGGCGRRSGRGRAGVARLPIALKPSHVRHDRPSVCGRDRPPVRGHQPLPVRDDVEELPVRVLQDLLLVERGGRHVASLEQNPFAVAASVVARLAVNRVALTAALDHCVVDCNRNRSDELAIRTLAREERRVLLQFADRDRAWNGVTHRRTVEEEHAGRLRANLRLVVHARIEMDRWTARRAAARAARQGDNGSDHDHREYPALGNHAAGPSSSGFGLRTLARYVVRGFVFSSSSSA